MSEPYRKDLTHLKWEEVLARQEQRGSLVAEWLNGAQLSPGDRVLDIGAGPGYVSLRAAELVGPTGLVIAVDRSAEALALLAQRQEERGITNIQRLVTDATSMSLPGESFDCALVTMMLHHADEPAKLLRNVALLLPAGARVVVAEFHPDAPCEMGPPKEHRISPAQTEEWCRAAGLRSLHFRRQTAEHYMLILERADGA